MLFYGKIHGYQEIGVYKESKGQMTRYLIENKVNCFDQVKILMS
ncbi:MAG: hypothetical protein ACLRQF_12330 [Thomasclavelia ramosa]